MEGEDAFYDDEGAGDDGGEGVGDATVGFEVVDGSVDGLAFREGAEVGDEELGFEGVRVVEVAFVAGVEGELREVAVVEVERKEGGVELVGEFAGEGGFAGAGAACDADEGGNGYRRRGRAHRVSVMGEAKCCGAAGYVEL